MPWSIVTDHPECNGEDGTVGVVKDEDGSLVACHMSAEAAQRQIDALYANEGKSGGNMFNKTFSAEVKALHAEGKPEGTFSAVVAVYGNVDRVGDRILDTAFDDTLKAWQASGDPIPVVLSHEWNDPFAHIGFVEPHKVKSVPGRGLVVEEGHLDIETNPAAAQVYRLMARRSLKEFSFGYTVPDGGQKKAVDGAFDLSRINLIELGPTLKGVNDRTELLAVKSALHGQTRTLDERLAALEKAIDDIGSKVGLEDILQSTTEEDLVEISEDDVDAEGKAWDGSQGNYTDEQYAAACIVDRADCGDVSDMTVKQRYSVPIAAPGNSWSENPDPQGVQVASGGRGVQAPQMDICASGRQKAAGRLLQAYAKLDKDPPQSIADLAGKSDEDIEKKSIAEMEAEIATVTWRTAIENVEQDLDLAEILKRGRGDDLTQLLEDYETELDTP